MKKLMTAVFFLTFAFTAFSQEITKIQGADIVCADKGGSVFINTKTERVWQGEGTKDKEALEFKVVDFQVNRCPWCYVVKAAFPGGTIKYAVSGAGSLTDGLMNISVKSDEGEESVIKTNVPCKFKSRN